MPAPPADRRLTRLCLMGAALLACALPVSEATAVQSGDASIAQDAARGTWTLTAGGAALTLVLNASQDFSVRGLTSPSGSLWVRGAAPDTSIVVNGTPLPFGRRSAGFVFERAAASTFGQSLQLDAVFDLAPDRLRVTRHYRVTARSPAFETWTSFEAMDRASARLSDLNAFELTVPPGPIRWLTGLRGDNSDVEHDDAFTSQRRVLGADEQLHLGAKGRSSEETVPWFAIDGPSDEFWGTLMWSGAWSLSVSRTTGGLALSFGLAPMTTTLHTTAIEGPHALFGVVRGGQPQAAAALQSYLVRGVRQGRALAPLVTYNTWFAYGTRIDDGTLRDQMARAAALGVELFIVDAGWYMGAGARSYWDFETGLGTWEPDADRFPHGLAPLTDYAHSLGLKFGLWVEPERVSLDTVGQPGLAQESWLATTGEHYGSATTAQICFASAAARQWVLGRLTRLIDTVRPDYLKWDNNFWINCDREGHGHGASDGNFAHVSGLYQVLASLRALYPDLIVENVSGGGNRLDLGMAQYSDVAWMDDRTTPSMHVRHNVEGLSAVFPPAYLLSFVLDDQREPIQGAPDLSLYFQSRMQGVLGLSFRIQGLSDSDTAAIQHEVAIYKAIRGAQAGASSALLTPQTGAGTAPAWDVLQETAPDNGRTIIWAIQPDGGAQPTTVKPAGLNPQAMYQVRSIDGALRRTVKGSDLMRGGIDIAASRDTAAHILIVTAQPAD